MTTLENLNHPQGNNIITEYTHNNPEVFNQFLFDTFIQQLEEEFEIYGLEKGKLTSMTESEQYYTFSLQGKGRRRTDVYFVPYEEDDKITIEWKFNPIQTNYIINIQHT